jgi:F0F1-type ATP synthase epsilon subunit
MADKKPQGRLKVRVFSPYQTFYQGDAESISAINKTGPFDVLYSHANFFSLLTQGDVKVATGFQNFSFPIVRGIMKVTGNQVTVFVDV